VKGMQPGDVCRRIKITLIATREGCGSHLGWPTAVARLARQLGFWPGGSDVKTQPAALRILIAKTSVSPFSIPAWG
jgi:hypothetical protein